MDRLRVHLGGAKLCSGLAGAQPVLPYANNPEGKMTLRVCRGVASAQPFAGIHLSQRGLGPQFLGHRCPFSSQRTSPAAPLTMISVAGRRRPGHQRGAGTRG